MSIIDHYKVRNEMRLSYDRTSDKKKWLYDQLRLYKHLNHGNRNQLLNINDKLPMDDINPFEVMGYNNLTHVQRYLNERCNELPNMGSIAIQSSCGSGKTMAVINVICKLKLRAMIVCSRTSLIDQWQTQLNQVSPSSNIINISKEKGLDVITDNSDIILITPQYLIRHNDLSYVPGIIIYDEIHSLVSEEFINTLIYPIRLYMNGRCDRLPILIALSATFIFDDKMLMDIIKMMFGKILTLLSDITKIPINVHTITSRSKIKDGVKIYQHCISEVLNKLPYQPSPSRKGIIVTHTIMDSIKVGFMVSMNHKVKVIIVRNNKEGCYVIENVSKDLMITILSSSDYDSGIKTKICQYQRDNYLQHINDAIYIVGTMSRLKEGFSCNQLTFGLCLSYFESIIVRIQLLGRIRRHTNDEELNNVERHMFVYVPPKSNYRPKNGRHYPIKHYDSSKELTYFEREGYHYVN